MKLTKLVNSVLCQIYSISEASAEFKAKYKNKFIIIYINDTVSIINTDELNINDLISPDGCVYMFTYLHKLSKKIIEDVQEFSKEYVPKMSNTMSTCLDNYYITKESNINLIMSIYPRTNIVSPLFNSNIIFRTNTKKIKLKNIQEQVCKIVNKVIKDKSEKSSELTTEQWLTSFINLPFFTPYITCVKYPNIINDKNVSKAISCKIYDIIIQYDVRANNYNEEFNIYTAIGEAFEKKNSTVIVFDTYNNKLKEITKQLDKHNVKYKRLNDYSISINYDLLKMLNITYELTDFI